MFCHTWNRQRQQGQSWDRGIVWSAYRGVVSDGRFYHNGYRHKAFLQYGSFCAWPCAAPDTDNQDRKSNLRTQTYGYRRADFQLKGSQNFILSGKGRVILQECKNIDWWHHPVLAISFLYGLLSLCPQVHQGCDLEDTGKHYTKKQRLLNFPSHPSKDLQS